MNNKVPLQDIIKQVEQNEQTALAFEQLELNLLAINDLGHLCQSIINDYQQTFSLEGVRLILFDDDGQYHALLTELGCMPEEGLKIFDSAQTAAFSQYMNNQVQLLSGEAVTPFVDMLGEEFSLIQSIAIMPLVRKDHHLGVLCFGSTDEQRYVDGMSTTLLERTAAVVGICLENALNFEKLRSLGYKDHLTKIFNRYYIWEVFALESKKLFKRKEWYCIYIDIQHVEQINHDYGLLAGDEILLEFTRRVKKQLGKKQVFARIAGKEFVIIAPGYIDDALNLAEKINDVMEAPISLFNQQDVHVQLLTGVSAGKLDTKNEAFGFVHTLIEQAGQAMQQARAEGADTIQIFQKHT